MSEQAACLSWPDGGRAAVRCARSQQLRSSRGSLEKHIAYFCARISEEQARIQGTNFSPRKKRSNRCKACLCDRRKVHEVTTHIH